MYQQPSIQPRELALERALLAGDGFPASLPAGSLDALADVSEPDGAYQQARSLDSMRCARHLLEVPPLQRQAQGNHVGIVGRLEIGEDLALEPGVTAGHLCEAPAVHGRGHIVAWYRRIRSATRERHPAIHYPGQGV